MLKSLVSKTQLLGLTVIVVVWRLALFAAGAVADRVLLYKPSFPYAYTLLPKYELPYWLSSWANFDGVHYLTIAERGYKGTGLIQAFFPMYPGLMAAVRLIVPNALLAGLLVSNLTLIVAVWLFFAWVKKLASAKIAWTAVLVLLLWPSSFFMGAVYSESLFLLVTLASLVAMQHKQWLWAAVFAALASATRIVGIGLMAALWLEWARANGWFVLFQQRTFGAFFSTLRQKLTAVRWWSWLVLLLPALGLGLYMAYLHWEFHDPLYFLHVQAEFGGGRQENIVLLPQVFWRYGKMLWSVRPFGIRYFSIVQEVVAAVVSLLLLVVVSVKGWRQKWQAPFPIGAIVFSWMAWILPTLTGTFSSLPRYILVCVPMWWLIAEVITQKRWLRLPFWLVGAALLVVNIWLFVQGYWVA